MENTGQTQPMGTTAGRYSNDFAGALCALKDGKKVNRSGWNGKGMFLYFVPSATEPAMTEVAKNYFGENVAYTAYIAMKTAQDYVSPWVASNTDLLADDWEVVE